MSCRGPHWRKDCPPRPRPQGSDSQNNRDWRCPGVPPQALVLITPEEAQVLISVEGQSIHFLFDTLGQLSLCSMKPLAHFPLDPLLRWGCLLPSSSLDGLTWWVSPLQGKGFIQCCEYLHQQQSYMWHLFMIRWHLASLWWTGITHCTLTKDVLWLLISTWFNDYFALHLELYNRVCFCLKVFRLQMIVHVPIISIASSNYYLGPLDQRLSIWG